ncbi:unnamed protein product [Diamesa hyperborea]
MATSRLEKIGNIFTRVQGLLKSGALKFEDRPIWYDVYKTFPPITEPRYESEPNNIKIQPIFYEEDKLRTQIDQNTLFNMNESQTMRRDPIKLQSMSMPQEKKKLFDTKDLNDLKE